MLPFPKSASFSGHETFPFRYAWLKKGVDSATCDPEVFTKQDHAMTVSGVGKNMVRSIRHWCLAANVLEEVPPRAGRKRGRLRPTKLGEALFSDEGWDPYLEDPATLWLLHWLVVSNAQRATTWFWGFSHHEPEFTKETLLAALQNWAATAGWKRISPGSLRRDLDCFIRTYVPSARGTTVPEDSLDCPLVELNLICETGVRHTFGFNRGPKPQLPNAILFYATLDYFNRHAPDLNGCA
jgi:hypothetical protein